MNYRFSTSSLICVQINDDLFEVGIVLPITKYLLIFIDGLQLRHSFSAPKRLDVKMPLQSIEPYRKSMFNSFCGRI